MENAPVLDACCGGRMFYFDKHDPRVVGQDIRIVPLHKIESNGSYFEVRPDVIGDFRKMEFPDESFECVVYDPPHLRCGETSFMFYKYGSLGAQWEEDLRRGFHECFRVLKPRGTLIFKWCDSYKSIDHVLALAPREYPPPTMAQDHIKKRKQVYMVCCVQQNQEGVE